MQNIFQPLKFVLFLCLFNATFIAAQDQRSGISYQALILNTSEVELPGANQKDSPIMPHSDEDTLGPNSPYFEKTFPRENK